MNTKKFLFFLFVLVSALPGFAADPEPSTPSDYTNTVEVVGIDQVSENLDQIINLVSNLQQVVVVSSSGSAASASLSSNLVNLLSATISFKATALNSQNGFGHPTDKTGNFLVALKNLNDTTASLAQLMTHLYVGTNNYRAQDFANGIKDYNLYNFLQYSIPLLKDDLPEFLDSVMANCQDIKNSLNEHLPYMLEDLDEITDKIYRLNNTIARYEQDYLSQYLLLGQTSTNQLQTIIYIVESLTNNVDNVDTNYYGDITNTLHDIAAGVSKMSEAIGDGWEPGGGSWPPGGGGDGSTNSVNLAYFDKWLKDWVDKYFYPADSSYVFNYDRDRRVLSIKDRFIEGIISYDVPIMYPGPHPAFQSGTIPFDNPHWRSGFANTLAAYNDGHTNYYDMVSALLTDIQTVNSQNYALFYMLATNILLQSADVDVEETKRDVNSLQETIDSYSSDVETMKTDLEYNFNSLKNKYEDIKEKSDQVFSYLGGLARLPTTDYYFDLPKLQFGEDLEFGGMEITLPLTNQHLVMVAEILRFFSICLYWGLFISMLYYAARGVVRMFLLLFKFMIYMGAIGTDK